MTNTRRLIVSILAETRLSDEEIKMVFEKTLAKIIHVSIMPRGTEKYYAIKDIIFGENFWEKFINGTNSRI